MIVPYGFMKKGDDSIPTGNLVMYLRFNNSLTDEVGNFTPTTSGTSYNNGLYTGSSLESIFNSAESSYTEIADNNLLTFGDGSTDSPFSVTFATQLSSTGSFRRFFSKRGNGSVTTSQREYESFVDTSGYIEIALYDESTGGVLRRRADTTALSAATVYHLAFTYDGSGTIGGLKIYIDGTESAAYTDNSSGSYTAMENTTSTFRIGKSNASVNNGQIGRYDGFGLWDIELSAAEVTAIYNKQSSGTEIL